MMSHLLELSFELNSIINVNGKYLVQCLRPSYQYCPIIIYFFIIKAKDLKITVNHNTPQA